MNHTEIGEVIEIRDNTTVHIKVKQTEKCGDCGSKSSCHTLSDASKERYVTALDPFGLKIGQRVKINLEAKNLVKASAIIFLSPLFGLFLGAIAGSYIAKSQGFQISADAGSVIGALLGLGISIIGLKIYNYILEKEKKFYPTVVEIM